MWTRPRGSTCRPAVGSAGPRAGRTRHRCWAGSGSAGAALRRLALGVPLPDERVHDNFKFTQVASQDPTTDRNGTYTGGAVLRDNDRFCLWCQELVTLRILEKTDQLLEDGDPSDVTTLGIVWYSRGSIGSAPTTTSSSTSPDRSPTMRPLRLVVPGTQRRAAVAIGPVLRADGRRRRRYHLAGAAALGRRAVRANRTRGPPLAPPPSGPKPPLIIRACSDVANRHRRTVTSRHWRPSLEAISTQPVANGPKTTSI